MYLALSYLEVKKIGKNAAQHRTGGGGEGKKREMSK